MGAISGIWACFGRVNALQQGPPGRLLSLQAIEFLSDNGIGKMAYGPHEELFVRECNNLLG